MTHYDPGLEVRAELRKVWSTSLVRHMGDMTQAELRIRILEKGVAVSRETVSNWVNGDTAPKPRHMAALAEVFGTTVAELFPIEGAA